MSYLFLLLQLFQLLLLLLINLSLFSKQVIAKRPSGSEEKSFNYLKVSECYLVEISYSSSIKSNNIIIFLILLNSSYNHHIEIARSVFNNKLFPRLYCIIIFLEQNFPVSVADFIQCIRFSAHNEIYKANSVNVFQCSIVDHK